MDNPASAQTFHRFTRLPPELRDRIWFFCLPCRVVPVDNPFLDPSKSIEQQCWITHPEFAHQAKAPPIIASVCREARRIAFRWGAVESQPYSYGTLLNVWIQRKLDTVLCAWTPIHSTRVGHDTDLLELFLCTQRHTYPSAPVCLLAEHFFEFNCNPSAPENSYTPDVNVDELEPESIAYILQDGRQPENEVQAKIDLSVAMDVNVVMANIYIHASRTDLLQSDLFGRNADERSQLVAYDDTATLAKFRALFEKNPRKRRRTALIKLLDDIESPEFLNQVKGWLVKVKWKLLALKWLHERRYNPQSSIYNEPMQVFDNPDINSGYLNMKFGPESINTFKVDHPWVIQETERLPKVKPKIWFTYCTRGCHVRRKFTDIKE